jgi:sugar-specific transcriptional regulator TrmB
MGVKKLRSRDMLYSRLLSQKAGDVRRSANKTVKAARETIRHSENLMEHARDVLERADKMLRNSAQGRKSRGAKKRGVDESMEKSGARELV